jgi:hypothetical protein
MADSGKKTIMQSMMQSALDAQSAAEIEKEKKKPVKVIKKGDMSPETKALPDEVVKPPKGIGESEKDMDPIPAKKKGGKITAANYDKEYGKIYRKAVKKMSSGGSVGSASKRADGIATKGKTRGKIC